MPSGTIGLNVVKSSFSKGTIELINPKSTWMVALLDEETSCFSRMVALWGSELLLVALLGVAGILALVGLGENFWGKVWTLSNWVEESGDFKSSDNKAELEQTQ